MKKILFLCLLTGAFLFSYAVDIVVKKPFIESYGLRTWYVDSVRLSDTATVVYGKMWLGKGWTASGDMDSYLEIPATGKSYKQKGYKGLPLYPEKVVGTGGKFEYEYVFPPIDPATKVINIVNKDNEITGSDVVWYGMWLVPRTTIFTEALSKIHALEGNWYNAGTWKAGFYAKKIYWNNEFWNFKVLSCIENNAKMELSKPKTPKVRLELQMGTDSILTLTANGNSEQLTKHQVYDKPDNSMFNTKFTKNDSITVSGYYQVVHPNYAKNAALLVSDLSITPIIYPIKMNEDGTFKVKIPLLHTTRVTFSNQLGYQTALSQVIFMAEPGNNIILSYRNENEKGIVFSGDNERVNNELQAFTNANPYFINERVLRSKMSQEWADNVTWRKEKFELLKLGYANWVKTHFVDAKFNTYMLNNLQYAPVSDLMKLYISGTRTVDFDGLPAATEIAFYNNPEAIILPEYIDMLNLFKPLQQSLMRTFTLGRIGAYLKETVSPTDKEISILNKFDSLQTSLKGKESIEKFQRFQKEDRTQLDSLLKKYQLEVFNFMRIEKEKSKQKYLIPEGFSKDFSAASDLLGILSKEESTLTDQQIDELKKNCKNQDLVDMVVQRNEALKNKLEKLKTEKLPRGVHTFTLPDDTKDLTAAILKKYKGKVVYVDFWATWCGPCKAEMPSSEKQKEHFKGKDVVFVYITGSSSPDLIWKKMIATIPGEHYKLSEKQWKEICNKYSITGIPHYLLFDKKGEMIDAKAPRPSTDSVLQTAIEKLLK